MRKDGRGRPSSIARNASMNKPTPSSRITADQDAIVTEIEIAAPRNGSFKP